MKALGDSLGSRRTALLLALLLILAITALPVAAGALLAYDPKFDVAPPYGEINVADIQAVAGAWNTFGDPSGADDKELIVAKAGGDFTSISAALNSITDNGPANPYLVRVLPGVYEEQIEMKSYVHLQGSGPGITILSYNVSSSASLTETATLRGAANGLVSDLMVRHLGNGSINVAIYDDSDDFVLDNVATQTLNGATCYGIRIANANDVVIRRADVVANCADDIYGISLSASTTRIEDSEVNVKFGNEENHAIDVAGSLASIRNTDAFAGEPDKARPQDLQLYGLNTVSSDVTVNGGVLYGSTASVFTLSDATSQISVAQLVNGKDGTGAYHCVGAFDASYTVLDAACN